MQESWPDLAKAGSELDKAGDYLALAGANWQELALIGAPENPEIPEKLRPLNELLEKPVFETERQWLESRDDPSQRPYWLNGIDLDNGQNCPPPQERAAS